MASNNYITIYPQAGSALYCSTRIGVHIHAKHAIFEYNLEEKERQVRWSRGQKPHCLDIPHMSGAPA